MNAKKTFRSQMELWLTLIFLTSLGWTFGLILTSVLIETFGVPHGSTASIILAGILGGLLISLISVFSLRNALDNLSIWMLSASLGWLLGCLATIFIIQTWTGVVGWIAGGAFGGLIYGFAQNYGIKTTSRAWLQWPFLNAVGWLCAYGLGYTLPSSLSFDQITSLNQSIAKGMLGWVMLGSFAVMLLILLFSTLKPGDRGAKVQWWP